ncbi:hypothetical protein CYMTET_55297 [Cymbomonas tetramitiformis]|uniref:Uncharacterized protein n=1 Tax=Cymbomonas tetramitiformis TaxID=36881 RepID=A0AAE0BDL1_9CHLO|nr:hypothetical protein CYMTET_55297 [Cymbomonas tetramitiformis]
MKSTHAPAVAQHEKLKHPMGLSQQLRAQTDFFGLKHGIEVKFCDCEAADTLDNEEWVIVDVVPALALGAVGQRDKSGRPRQQKVSTTRDNDSTGNIGRRGAAKRKSYEAFTKVEVLEVFDRCVSNGSLAPKEDVAGLTGVHASLISKWAVPKTRQEIYTRAGSDKQKHLRKKARIFTGTDAFYFFMFLRLFSLSIILFKWFKVGWQLGRVRKKLPANKDGFNFQRARSPTVQ